MTDGAEADREQVKQAMAGALLEMGETFRSVWEEKTKETGERRERGDEDKGTESSRRGQGRAIEERETIIWCTRSTYSTSQARKLQHHFTLPMRLRVMREKTKRMKQETDNTRIPL
eukprot:748498-Hanusia_phi.AAC.2